MVLRAHGLPVLTGLSLLALAVVAAAQPGQTVRVTVTKEDCSRLVKHVPDPDVTYRAGVDVLGRPVAPADLGGGVALALPDVIVVDLEVDLFRRFGIPVNPALFEVDAELGLVVVDSDGRAYYNTQPLQDEITAELGRRCQEVLRETK